MTYSAQMDRAEELGWDKREGLWVKDLRENNGALWSIVLKPWGAFDNEGSAAWVHVLYRNGTNVGESATLLDALERFEEELLLDQVEDEPKIAKGSVVIRAGVWSDGRAQRDGTRKVSIFVSRPATVQALGKLQGYATVGDNPSRVRIYRDNVQPLRGGSGIFGADERERAITFARASLRRTLESSARVARYHASNPETSGGAYWTAEAEALEELVVARAWETCTLVEGTRFGAEA